MFLLCWFLDYRGSDRIVIVFPVWKFKSEIVTLWIYSIPVVCMSMKHCRVLQLYLGAGVSKKGQLFRSSSALPSTGSLGTVYGKPLSSLQREVPAETIAIHPNTQTGYLVSWKLFGKTKEHTQTHAQVDGHSSLISTGAALILNTIPDNLSCPPGCSECESNECFCSPSFLSPPPTPLKCFPLRAEDLIVICGDQRKCVRSVSLFLTWASVGGHSSPGSPWIP